MLVHTLELADRTQLGRAFEAVMDSEGLSDCAVEIDVLRIRFVAPDERAARIIRSIARGGGLRTATREWVETGLVRSGGRSAGVKTY